MRKYSLVIASGVLAVALTACGTNQAIGLNSSNAVLAAVTKTTDAKTSKVSVSVSTTVAGQNVSFSGDGAFDYANSKGQLTLNVPAIAGQSATTLTELVDGQTLYLKEGTTNTWEKVDLSKVASSVGASTSSISQNQANPTQGLDLLKGASDSITKVGTETIRDTKTTHYKLTLDFDKAATTATGAEKTALQKAATQYNHQTVPADVWVDSSDRIRKLTLNVDLSKLNVTSSTTIAPTTGSLTISEELYDFGTSVDVTAPPAAQVQDATALASSAAQSAQN